MKKEKKKFDYNVIIIALCFMMVLLGMGVWGARGLFVVPITSALGISRSEYSLADTARYISSAAVNIFFGYLVSKFGSKKLVCAGFFAYIGAALLYALANQVWMFYIGGILLGIAFSWTGTTIVGYVVNKVCKNNRGTIMGFVLASNGLSGAIMAQIISPIINEVGNPFGYRNAYFLMAGISVVMLIILLFFYREPKSENIEQDIKAEKKSRGASWIGIAYNDATKKAYFYYACICILFTGFVLQSVTSVAAAHMSDVGLGGAYIATVTSIASLSLATFKFINGFIYDRTGLRFTITIDGVAAVLAISCLLFMKNSVSGMVLAMAYAIFAGLALPLETVMIPIYANDLFGDKSFSKVLGIFISFNQVGYALGAPVINLFYDFTGSYNLSFVVCITLMLMILFILQFVITSAHCERKRIENAIK